MTIRDTAIKVLSKIKNSAKVNLVVTEGSITVSYPDGTSETFTLESV